MNIFKSISISGLALMIVFLAACSSKEEQTEQPEPSEQLEDVTLSEVTRSVFYTPQYAAIEKGFFEEEGLNVELTTTWGGDKTMTALLSDNTDIALVGSETSIYVYGQEATDLAINFAQLTQTDGTFLVGKTDNPDFTWDDVKDTSFLGQRKGGMPQMVGEFVLKNNQINPHEEVDLDQSIDYANIPGAFASGDYEYVQLFEPTASTFEEEGKGHILASFGEEAGDIPYTVFMAKESYLNENDAIVKSFTKAIYKAQQWVDETDSETIAEVIHPFFEDTDVSMLAASIDRYKAQDSFATDPLLKEDAWNNLQEIMKEAGELSEEAPYDVLVNTDIANELSGN